MKKQIIVSLAMAAVAVAVSGCASVQRAAPTAPGQVNINLEKGDYTMLGSVKGSSTVVSYCGGVVQVVDGDKVRVLGLRNFEDQYSFQTKQTATGNTDLSGMLYDLMKPIAVEDRAYYKALAATPDADVVIPKALTKQKSGIPFICEEETATFTGKAVKYRSE